METAPDVEAVQIKEVGYAKSTCSGVQGTKCKNCSRISAISVVPQQQEQQKTLMNASLLFPGVNTVIMWENPDGSIKFLGRPDIVKFLGGVHPSRLPWKEYSFS